MSFKSDLESLVLGSLQGESLHGYEIAKRIASKSEGLLRVGEGQLYPALHSLERQGLVTAEWIPQEGKPARKIYSLTQAGVTELERKREGWDRFSRGVSAILGFRREAARG